MIIMFFIYLPSNWPTRADWTWLKRAGGMLGGEHPPSHRFNAGEKIVFWGGMLVLGARGRRLRASRSTRSSPGST